VPYHHPVIFKLNRKFSKLGGRYDPRALLGQIGGARTLVEVAAALDLASDPDVNERLPELLDFVGTMPDALDVAVVAALKQALQDEYWIQITWQPGVAWELRTWALEPEGSAERGVLNLSLISPNPPEA
jgi:hypothetical protein